MKRRFILYRRKRGGIYYLEDTETRKQTSLGTRSRTEALTLLTARNEAVRQPQLNLQIARTYLAASDLEVSKRTWAVPMNEIVKSRSGTTRERWLYAVRDPAFDMIRNLPLFETRAEHLLRAMEAGTVSTNVYLRRIHNYAVDMGWLPWPLIPRNRWPKVAYRDKRAITLDEHRKILAAERNPEWYAYYELLWHFGASQTDLATIEASNIDWTCQTLCYERTKTGTPAQIAFGDTVVEILRCLPRAGCLFPRISELHEKHRAKQFRRRCLQLGLEGISLHSYRYAWAERARKAGYPERFAQEALGHNSKAVHRAYAKRALVTLPSLEKYEENALSGNIIPMIQQTGASTVGWEEAPKTTRNEVSTA